MQQLQGNFPAEFEGVVADRKGDLLVLLDRRADAIAEYKIAFKTLDETIEYRRLVEIKLNALGVDPGGSSTASTSQELKNENCRFRNLSWPYPGARACVLPVLFAALLSGCSLWGGSKAKLPELGKTFLCWEFGKLGPRRWGAVPNRWMCAFRSILSPLQLRMAAWLRLMHVQVAICGVPMSESRYLRGVGTDGRYAAVVSHANALVLLDQGKEVASDAALAGVYGTFDCGWPSLRAGCRSFCICF